MVKTMSDNKIKTLNNLLKILNIVAKKNKKSLINKSDMMQITRSIMYDIEYCKNTISCKDCIILTACIKYKEKIFNCKKFSDLSNNLILFMAEICKNDKG